MKTTIHAAIAAAMIPMFAAVADPVAVESVWPAGKTPDLQANQSVPTIEWWLPAKKTTDACLIVAPGGGYSGLAYAHEGALVASNFCSRGVTVVVLKYRVPRPAPSLPFYRTAWQDAQRAVRLVRSRAADYGIATNRIGMTGFSAGGHLTLMTATSSRTAAYAPVDEIDRLPCNLDFAIPVYPAYVLSGSNGKGKEDDAKMCDDFAFDESTPPMCFVHGDNDPHSALGSIRVYERLRARGLPAELHVLAEVSHGFGGSNHARANWNHYGWELLACRFMAKIRMMPNRNIFSWSQNEK